LKTSSLNYNFKPLLNATKGNVLTFPFALTTNQLYFLLFIFSFNNATADNQTYELSTGLDYIYFEEKSSTNISVKEHGVIPTIHTAYKNTNARQFSVISSYLSAGKINYDGKTQANKKIKSSSYATIANIDFILGHWFHTKVSSKTGFTIGAGYRYWDRAIQSTNTALGLREKYTWNYASMGIRFRHTLQSKNTIQLSTEILKPFNAVINIEQKNSFDSIDLILRPQISFRLNGEWLKLYNPQHLLFLAFKLEVWRMNKSNTRQLTINNLPSDFSITEPASFSLQAGLTAGLKWK